MVIVQKKSSGTWWKCLLSFIGGFIFAFVAVAGGLAFVGTQVTAGDLLNLAQPNLADTVLTVEYQQMTAFDIVMSFVNQQVDYNTLGGISEVTPLVDTYLGKLNELLDDKAGFTLDLDELKGKTWGEIPQYLGDTAKQGVKIAKIAGIDESSDNILQTLCYPKNPDNTFDYEHPYSIADVLDDPHFIQNKIDTMTIKDIIGEAGDGASKVVKSIENYTLYQLKNEDVFGGLLISDIIEIDDSSPQVLKAIKNKTVNQLKNDDVFGELKVSELIEVTDSSSNVLKAIKDKTVNELRDDDVFGDLLISDIIDIDDSSPQVLKTFKANGTKVNQMSDAINDMYLSDVIEITDSSPKILKTFRDKGTKLNNMDDAINDLYISDVIEITDSSPKILKTFRDKGTKLNDMSDVVDNLFLSDVYESDNPDALPAVMQKLLGSEAVAVHAITNPFTAHIDYEKYAQIYITNGNDPTAEGYIATNYADIKEFYGKASLEVTNGLEGYEISGVGTHDRSDLDPRVFDIEVTVPAGWDPYYILCNKPTKVKELDKSIDELTLKDCIKMDSTSPLYKVRHSSIKDADQLFDDIKNILTIKDIFGDDLDDYKFINKLPENTTLNNIGEAINNMKLIDAFDDNIYTTAGDSGQLRSMWKYLLIEGTEEWITGNPTRGSLPFTGYACEEYTVSGDGDGTPGNPKGINQMMENMKYWMENQKLRILQQDGMINITGNLLTSEIPTVIRAYDNDPDPTKRIIPSTAVYYGDLNTRQFVELMTKIPLLTS